MSKQLIIDELRKDQTALIEQGKTLSGALWYLAQKIATLEHEVASEPLCAQKSTEEVTVDGN